MMLNFLSVNKLIKNSYNSCYVLPNRCSARYWELEVGFRGKVNHSLYPQTVFTPEVDTCVRIHTHTLKREHPVSRYIMITANIRWGSMEPGNVRKWSGSLATALKVVGSPFPFYTLETGVQRPPQAAEGWEQGCLMLQLVFFPLSDSRSSLCIWINWDTFKKHRGLGQAVRDSVHSRPGYRHIQRILGDSDVPSRWWATMTNRTATVQPNAGRKVYFEGRVWRVRI